MSTLAKLDNAIDHMDERELSYLLRNAARVLAGKAPAGLTLGSVEANQLHEGLSAIGEVLAKTNAAHKWEAAQARKAAQAAAPKESA